MHDGKFTPFAMRTAPKYIHCYTTFAYVVASALVKKNLAHLQRYAPKSIKSSQQGKSTKVKCCCIHTKSREQQNATFAMHRFKRTNPNTLNACDKAPFSRMPYLGLLGVNERCLSYHM